MLVPLIRPTTQQHGQLALSVQQLAMPFKMFIFFSRSVICENAAGDSTKRCET